MNATGFIEGPLDAPLPWNRICWETVRRNVSRLQARIVKAVRAGRWHRVRSLQRLLRKSLGAKLLAVQRVTSNRGKNTAGVDGIVLKTPEQKWQQAQALHRQGYQPLPVRRIYIPKKNGKKRALGIPAQCDRAEQALDLLALDPVSETLADSCSYGFRKERNSQDAMARCFTALSKRTSAEWILEGDIRACFDAFDHEWLVEHTPTHQGRLRAWLKSGFMEQRRLFPTDRGTAQGGVISPTVANMALDGLEDRLRARFKRRGKVNLIRFADDFVITGESRAILEQDVMPLVTEFLKERGLVLAPEKTRIVHIDEGFDFLGFHFRKYGGKLLIKPSRASIGHLRAKVEMILQKGRHWPQSEIIGMLNPVLRGWGNYFRHVVSQVVFQKLDHWIWRMTWNWARRRHPQKNQRWIKERYFHQQAARKWVYGDDRHTLVSLARIPIRRHVHVRSGTNPYDPQDADYFQQRRAANRAYPSHQGLASVR
ncbi:group II intron reverse transcriptase/maturase [Thioalkalivibrio thiocyanodenitrificans]|uniref:group II intron reverse transcriptase/maturase n=1 Tax=Thioalkalivibrio thiocyanodenitrificans TaxID=243063 RepID=UPI0006885596|nr:group II intron reverse transcriptase/maturase [Thioalkalivibrio thiocyanodenitrificans]